VSGGGTCTILMYHYVRDTAASPFPGLMALAPAAFEAQLDWLAARYDLIGLEALEAAILEGRPLDRDAALLTFDDGFVDHYEVVLPRLRARGLAGVFFLAGAVMEPRPALLNVHATHFLVERLGAAAFAAAVRDRLTTAHPGDAARWAGIYRLEGGDDRAAKRLLNYEVPFDEADRILDALFREHVGDPEVFADSLYLSRRMVGEMAAAGMRFGFHTHRHRVLARLDAAGQAREVGGGVARIREWTGQDTVPFCYPYGRPVTYDATTLDLLAREGYSLGFTTVRRTVEPARVGRFEVPRFDTNDLPPRGTMTAGAAGREVPAVAP
jgi:peptidoglycan/xylan/chitin deacetylase (PgdA/CDA1 family)